MVHKATILRKGFAEFYRRYFRDQGRKDGMVGFVEALVQAINRILVFIQIWEKQQQPPLRKKYQLIEKELAERW